MAVAVTTPGWARREAGRTSAASAMAVANRAVVLVKKLRKSTTRQAREWSRLWRVMFR
jgi:hypothetical protein